MKVKRILSSIMAAVMVATSLVAVNVTNVWADNNVNASGLKDNAIYWDLMGIKGSVDALYAKEKDGTKSDEAIKVISDSNGGAYVNDTLQDFSKTSGLKVTGDKKILAPKFNKKEFPGENDNQITLKASAGDIIYVYGYSNSDGKYACVSLGTSKTDKQSGGTSKYCDLEEFKFTIPEGTTDNTNFTIWSDSKYQYDGTNVAGTNIDIAYIVKEIANYVPKTEYTITGKTNLPDSATFTLTNGKVTFEATVENSIYTATKKLAVAPENGEYTIGDFNAFGYDLTKSEVNVTFAGAAGAGDEITANKLDKYTIKVGAYDAKYPKVVPEIAETLDPTGSIKVTWEGNGTYKAGEAIVEYDDMTVADKEYTINVDETWFVEETYDKIYPTDSGYTFVASKNYVQTGTADADYIVAYFNTSEKYDGAKIVPTKTSNYVQSTDTGLYIYDQDTTYVTCVSMPLKKEYNSSNTSSVTFTVPFKPSENSGKWNYLTFGGTNISVGTDSNKYLAINTGEKDTSGKNYIYKSTSQLVSANGDYTCDITFDFTKTTDNIVLKVGSAEAKASKDLSGLSISKLTSRTSPGNKRNLTIGNITITETAAATSDFNVTGIHQVGTTGSYVVVGEIDTANVKKYSDVGFKLGQTENTENEPAEAKSSVVYGSVVVDGVDAPIAPAKDGKAYFAVLISGVGGNLYAKGYTVADGKMAVQATAFPMQ